MFRWAPDCLVLAGSLNYVVQPLTSFLLQCVNRLKFETQMVFSSICHSTQTLLNVKNEPWEERPANNFIKWQQRCCENTMPSGEQWPLVFAGVSLARLCGEICHGNMFGPRVEVNSTPPLLTEWVNCKWITSDTHIKNCLQLTTTMSLSFQNTHINIHVGIYTHMLWHSVIFRPNNNQQLVLFPCVCCSFTSHVCSNSRSMRTCLL